LHELQFKNPVNCTIKI